MKKLLSTLCYSIVLFSLEVDAQDNFINPIEKGNVIPDIPIKMQLGDSSQTMLLSDLKGQPLLLDFWGVHCPSCIAELPKLLELQEIFSGKLKIIVVTKDNWEDIQKLWSQFEKNPSTKHWAEAGKKMTFIAHDTIFYRLFPHKLLGVHVWIKSDMVYENSAVYTSTNSENILKFLKNETPELDIYKYVNLDINKPLSWIGSDSSSLKSKKSYSFLTGQIEDGVMGSSFHVIVNDSITNSPIGVNCLNNSILDLYRIAYENSLLIKPFIPDNRIVFEVRNRDRVYPSPYIMGTALLFQWKMKNTFCYASKVPVSNSGNIYHIMQKDLDSRFNFKSKVETRRIKCLILRRTSKEIIYKSKDSEGKQVYETGNGKLRIKNLAAEQLYMSLAYSVQTLFNDIIYLDETRYKGNIDITLPWKQEMNEADFALLKNSLRQYGLELLEDYRNVKVVVIQDR